MRAAVAFALLSGSLLALDPSKSLQEFARDAWDVEQGLPRRTVNAIAQTRDGYIWFGTPNGVARFDGVRFVTFDRHNTPAIRNNFVQAMLASPDGALWIGTEDGLVRMMDGRFEEVTTPRPFFVRALVLGLDGSILIGTQDHGFGRLEKGSLRLYGAAAGLPSENVWSVAPDPDGSIWIGTQEGGLAHLVAERCTTLSAELRFPGGRVTALLVDRTGTLWVGSTSRGGARITRFRGGSPFENHSIAGAAFVYALCQDRDGAVWAGLSGSGVARIWNGDISFLSNSEGLPSNVIRSIAEDREGSVWIGTIGGGLIRLRAGRVSVVAPGMLVRTVTGTPAGDVFLGTFGAGVFRYSSGSRAPLDVALPSKVVRTTLAASDGSLWVGSESGLAHVVGSKVTVYDKQNGLPGSSVNALFEDREGRLWIGAYGGLARLDPDGRITVLGRQNVSALLRAREGSLWIGTYDSGLQRLVNGTFESFGAKQGLTVAGVSSLHEDSDGILWVGTYQGGLNRFERGRLTALTRKSGLPFDTVYQVLEDDSGFLWLSSDLGIARVSRAQANDVARGRRQQVDAMHLDVGSGLLTRECSGGSQPAGWKGPDGRLWFATAKGVAVIDPRRLEINTVPPPVVIEEVISGTRVLSRSSRIELPSGKEGLEIHYTALSFLAPQAVRFKYRLEGFDDHWVDAETRRTAYFTNLPHGHYAFRVKACNNDGVWNEAGAVLDLVVKPRFHETNVFFFLVALGVMGVGYGAYRFRLHQHVVRERELIALVKVRTLSLERAVGEAEEANRAKSAFLANMSHELRTPLNAVIGFSQLVRRDPSLSPVSRENLAIIERSGEHLLGLINDVLSLARIESGKVTLSETPFDLLPTLRGVVDMLRVRAEAKGLALVFEPAPELPIVVLGDEAKLRQVLINLLGNAIKFTERGRAGLRASWHDDVATFEVFDTGPGIGAQDAATLFRPFVQTAAGQSKEGTGLGLAISRTYAQLMGGDIHVASEPGMGSTFTVTMRLPEAHAAVRPVSSARRAVGLASGQAPVLVLVADDRADNRLLPSRLLSSVGLAVCEARDGHEAVEQWKGLSPHVVFMDMRMPVLDGREATRRIRQIEEETGSPRTVVVALSASAFAHERAVFTAAGCDDFIPKPFREGEVFSCLTRLAGIRFTYEEELDAASAAPAPTSSSAIPAELREELRRAFLAEGDQEKALHLAARVTALDGAFGRELEARIRAIDLDAVEEMLR